LQKRPIILRSLLDLCRVASHERRDTAEYCLFYRALLQKRPIILRSLLDLCCVAFHERSNTATYERRRDVRKRPGKET